MKVEDIMSSPAFTVRPDCTAKEAASHMVENHHGFLVVVDHGRVVGVVTDKDVLRAASEHHLDGLFVENVMTRDVISVDADQSVPLAANIMKRNDRKRLPVLKDGRVVGVISSQDIIERLVDVKKALLDMAIDF